MRDYLKLLRHLMQINGEPEWMSSYRTLINYDTAGREVPNAILKADTVHGIFVPALPENGIKSLSDLITIQGTSWSTALAVCASDLPGRRRNGSGWCKLKKVFYTAFK